MGSSGSGKSTCIALLERFYDPTTGCVTFDGHDLRAINLRQLRAKLSLVGQEPVLFMGTVADNIKYGALAGGEVDGKGPTSVQHSGLQHQVRTQGGRAHLGARARHGRCRIDHEDIVK
eukprot:6357277-Pyramimonas_sp.AAC.2